MDSLPFLEEVDLSEVDMILISHYHLDHVAALPYLLKNKDVFKGKVYMTHPTKSIYKALLQDFVRVTNASGRDTLYTAQDVADTMPLIEAINFHQVITHRGIRFWTYHAGHVLGAAMFMIEIDGIRFLYTGDYSRSEDRHLVAAEIPATRPDVLIVEATHGTQQHEPVAFRERRFVQFVHQVVLRGGKCLIPQFALGRSQELLLVLEEFWEANPHLHSVPIYYMSALAKKCLKDYQTYTYMMNSRVQARAQARNPFRFRHVVNIPLLSHFEGIEHSTGPCVVMASPGMLQNGWSRKLFDSWCVDPKNGLMLAGYSVENTLAHTIQTSSPTEITTQDGLRKDLAMSVGVVPFTAHADFAETSAFIEQLKPRFVIFVHGNKKEMTSLEKRLASKYAGDKSIEFFSPENSQPVALSFVKRRTVRLVGSLTQDVTEPVVATDGADLMTEQHPDHQEDNRAMISPQDQDIGQVKDGSVVSGVVVRSNYNYMFLRASDLPNYTHIKTTSVRQRVTVPFHQSFELAKIVLSQMYDVEEIVQNYSAQKRSAPGTMKNETNEGENDGENDGIQTKDSSISDIQIKKEILDELENDLQHSSETQVDDVDVNEQVSKQTSQDVQVRSLLIHGCVRLSYIHGLKGLSMSWLCGSLADMVSDSIVALLMATEANPVVAKMLGDGSSCSHEHDHMIPADQPTQPQESHQVAGSVNQFDLPKHSKNLLTKSAVLTDYSKDKKITMLQKKLADHSSYVWTSNQIEEMVWFLYQKYGGTYFIKPYSSSIMRNKSTTNENAPQVMKTSPDDTHQSQSQSQQPSHLFGLNELAASQPSSSHGFSPVIAFELEGCAGEIETQTLRVYIHRRYIASCTTLSLLKRAVFSDRQGSNLPLPVKKLSRDAAEAEDDQALETDEMEERAPTMSDANETFLVVENENPTANSNRSQGGNGTSIDDAEVVVSSPDDVIAIRSSMEQTLNHYFASVKQLMNHAANIYSREDLEPAVASIEELEKDSGLGMGMGMGLARENLRRKNLSVGLRRSESASDHSDHSDSENKVAEHDEAPEPETISGGFSSEDDDGSY